MRMIEKNLALEALNSYTLNQVARLRRVTTIVALGLVFWVSLSFLPVTPEKVADQSLPNIVFIMADQMR